MANTTVVTGKVVQITGLDADWEWNTDLPDILKNRPLASVLYKAHGANDVFVLRNGSITGAKVFNVKSAGDTSFLFRQFHRDEQVSPVFESTDLTVGGATAMVILTFY